MQFRLWNSFNFLAVILLAIGIIGALSGGKMVFDPGRLPSGKEWIIYFVAGALMLVNGFLPPANNTVTKSPSEGVTDETSKSVVTVPDE